MLDDAHRASVYARIVPPAAGRRNTPRGAGKHEKETGMRRLWIAVLAALLALGAGCATTDKSGSASSGQYPAGSQGGSGYRY